MSVTIVRLSAVSGDGYLLQVDVAEHELLVAAADDGGPVATELAEDGGLRLEDHLLLVRQVPRPVHNKVK